MPELYSYPEITSVAPSNGVQDVDVNSKIEVIFSASMAFSEQEHATLGRITDSRIFYVTRQIDKQQVDVPGTLTYNPLKRKATFTPNEALVASATYNIIVVGADMNKNVCAQDTRGNPLKFSLNSTFHTQEVALSIPNTVSPSDKSKISGQVTLVWNNQDDSSVYEIQVSPQNDFILTVFTTEDAFVKENGQYSITPNYAFLEGRYYWRVRQANGQFSAPSQFYYEEEVLTPAAPPTSDKPTVVSSYPKANSMNTLPASIKIKLSATADDLVYGTDVKVFNRLIDTSELEDLDILPYTVVPCTMVQANNVLTITPNLALNNGTVYSVVTMGQLYDGVFSFTTTYQFISAFIADIQDTISKYLSADLLEIYKTANAVAKDAFAKVAATYEETQDTQYNITVDGPPSQVIKYVLYRTEYEMLVQQYMALTSSSSTKILADMTIINTAKPADLAAFLDVLLKLTREFDDWLNGQTGRGSAKPVTGALRGGSVKTDTGYPTYMTRDYT